LHLQSLPTGVSMVKDRLMHITVAKRIFFMKGIFLPIYRKNNFRYPNKKVKLYENVYSGDKPARMTSYSLLIQKYEKMLKFTKRILHFYSRSSAGMIVLTCYR